MDDVEVETFSLPKWDFMIPEHRKKFLRRPTKEKPVNAPGAFPGGSSRAPRTVVDVCRDLQVSETRQQRGNHRAPMEEQGMEDNCLRFPGRILDLRGPVPVRPNAAGQ